MLGMEPQHAPGARRAALVLSALVLAALPFVALAAPPARDLFDDIFARSKPIDATLKTIHASFTETTISPLLAKPLVAEGTLAATRPSDVELIYTTPGRKTITIKGGKLIVEMPGRQFRQEQDITQAQERIQKYFVTKTPDALRKMFDVTAVEDAGRPGTYRIDLQPKRKQIEQGLTKLELWIKKDTLMLDAMRMYFPGDAVKMMEFRDVVINKGAADAPTPSTPRAGGAR
jgi:outer membrane lipoprotein-sorting protein